MSFERTVMQLYTAAQDPAAWPAALTAMAEQAGGVGAMLLMPGGGRIHLGRLDPDRARLFTERHLDNRYARSAGHLPRDTPVLGSTVWDPAEARRSALYAEVLAPQRIADKVFIVHSPWRSPAVAVGGVSIYLGSRAAAEPRRAVKVMSRLAPHLRQALDITAALDRSRRVQAGLVEALTAMPGAVVLVEHDGRAWHVNPAAEALLRPADGLALRRGAGGVRLVAEVPSEHMALTQLVARAAAGGVGGRLRVTRPSGAAPWSLLVVSLSRGVAGEHAPGHPATAILIGGPDLPVGIGALRDAFGLTAAEARVAQHMAGGAGTPATAAALGLSPETVRTHLARCFDATGVRSQAALAALLARLPGPLDG